MKTPHIRRSTFWSYLLLAVPSLSYFGSESDASSTPVLIKAEYLPNLLFFAIHDIADRAEKTDEKLAEVKAKAIKNTQLKLRTAMRAGVLSAYDPVMFLRADPADLGDQPDSYLVRLDDFAGWCSTQGIEISPFPNEINGESNQQKNENEPGKLDIDPYDLPDELSAANIAFRAVSNGYGDPKATFKNRLLSYLESNYAYMNSETIQRVATVANPDKGRGRKKVTD